MRSPAALGRRRQKISRSIHFCFQGANAAGCFPCLRPNFTSFPHDLVAVRIREVRIAVRTVSEFLAASFRAVGRLPGNVLRIVDVRIVIADGCVMNILTVISNLRCLPFRFCPPAESICCFVALIKGIIADARHAPPGFGMVNISNRDNTAYDRDTGATPDGRLAGDSLSNASNPTAGMDKNGVTAFVNSLLKARGDIHFVTVQNSPRIPSTVCARRSSSHCCNLILTGAPRAILWKKSE